MRRRLIVAAALAAVSLVPAAEAQPAHSASAARIQLRRTSLGRILVNARGFTLYMFTSDRRNHDRCVRISGCASVWPPLMTSGHTAAGRGIKRSLIGSIRLAGGHRQVTYAGHPLYTYVGDSGPGSTSYVGFKQFGGVWRALNAAGKPVG